MLNLNKLKRGQEEIYNKKTVKDYYKIVGKDIDYKKMGSCDRYLLKILPKKLNNKIVLDIGCGNGKYSQLFCKLGTKRVDCIDRSKEMILEVEKRKKREKLNQLNIIFGDIDRYLFKKNEYDLIFSRFSLCHVKNLNKTIKNIVKSLKMNGQMYILTDYAEFKSTKLFNRLVGSIIPLYLISNNKKVKIKNYIHRLEDYKKAIKKAGFILKIEKSFQPTGLSIYPRYQFKEIIKLKYIVLKAEKIK